METEKHVQNPTRLVLIRHGESQVTVDQIVGGPKACNGLSDLGSRQAAALRDRWGTGNETPIDVLWSSTMPRAIETAELVNESLQLKLHQDVELEEWRPGEADGMTWAEASEAFSGDLAMEGMFAEWAPGSESMRELHFRAGRALDKLVRAHLGQSIMCVVHAGVIDVAFRMFLDLPQLGNFYLSTENASVTELVLGADAKLWQLLRYNDASHIRGLVA